MRILILGSGAIAAVALFAVVPGGRDVSHAAGACRAGEALTTDFGEWFSPSTIDLGPQGGTIGKLVPTLLAPAVAVRLQIQAASSNGQRWSVVLRDPQLRVLAILSEQDFGLSGGGNATQWTGRLDSSQVSAELVGGGPGVRIRFAAGMALPANSEGVNVFSTQTAGVPTWRDPFSTNTILYQKATQAVGMLATGMRVPTAGGGLSQEAWCCSGAMLTSDIFITNWHCGAPSNLPASFFWNEQVQSNAIIDLGWQNGPAPRRQYMVTQVLQSNERLDYALLRVRPTIGPGSATGRALPVKVSRTLPSADDVFVVHHAQCKPKLVSSNCRINDRSYRAWTDPLTRTSGPDITHKCDTEPGASGSPVFDMAGNMIALHHLGFQKADAANQCASDKLNKAVTMDSILADLQQAKPALYNEVSSN